MTATLPAARAKHAAARPTRVPARLRTPQRAVRFRSSPADLALCGVLLAAIVLVQGWNIAGYPNFSDDEGTYLAQAWAVQQGEGLAHYTYWYDHPPLGWFQLAAVSWIPSLVDPSAMTVGTMRLVMLGVSAVSAVLLYVFARRLRLPMWAAGLAMALFGLSPLSVVLQREIFLDNIAVMWLLLAFCLAASPSRHLWHHFAAGLAAATGVLSKETMLVLLPALLVTMWRHGHPATRKFALTGAITACALVGFSYPLFALLKGELFPGDGHVSLWDGIAYQMSRPGSGFILDTDTGSYGVLHSWLYYDKVLVVGGLAGALFLLAVLRWSVSARALAGPALAVAVLALVALRPSGYLPAMYIVQALPFLALVIAGAAASVVHALVLRGPARVPAGVRLTAVAVLAACAAGFVVPRWYEGDRTAMTTDANAPYRGAAAWMAKEVADPASTRVLVDDALWLDLVHAGYEPGLGAIWFYKADLDPAVTRTMPHGWRDLDYVVASPTVRRDAAELPGVRAALRHSEPVATFGTGEDRIEIRRIQEGGTR
ncbi:phospholipid carrier-dependent glycosyltransferase [Streptomyces kunmingensis]|uniref:Phospholipid carrier-dependent glycosyltransferase n=1 Tax=Streptomyces kunmingensis TaxID=68225 RepID=A0ABU6CH77_9ACTN|nr:phospholipid carrier-dependent glycosyltransferase [Streptomyces kunmingensis]MEB3964078.1 phospholipid carrier-dependent glycosyltransferase [Streptomyces kunmingensis]